MLLRERLIVVGTVALLCGLTILLSIRFIDRPLARLAASFHLYDGFLASTWVTSPALVALLVGGVLVSAVLLSREFDLPAWCRSAAVAAILAGLATSWGLCLVELVLKPLFARHDPFDYLDKGIYGFVWFTRADDLGSFPSGHAVQITAVASVLWHICPKARVAWGAAIGLGGVALILAERHFLSDIVAGGLVGFGSAELLLQLWKTHVFGHDSVPRAGGKPEQATEAHRGQ